MKAIQAFLIFLTVIVAFAAGIFIGSKIGRAGVHARILSGPYSDDFGPALRTISSVKTKILNGETNIVKDLETAEAHITRAQSWTQNFLNGLSDKKVSANSATATN